MSDGNTTSDVIVSKPSQKRTKKRPPEIAEIGDINDESRKEKTAVKSINLEGNKDHLETKKQIESLRKQYGDGWLHSQGASMVHDVLGIKNEMEKSTTSVQMIKSLLEETGSGMDQSVNCFSSTPNKPSFNKEKDLNSSSEVGECFLCVNFPQ